MSKKKRLEYSGRFFVSVRARLENPPRQKRVNKVAISHPSFSSGMYCQT